MNDIEAGRDPNLDSVLSFFGAFGLASAVRETGFSLHEELRGTIKDIRSEDAKVRAQARRHWQGRLKDIARANGLERSVKATQTNDGRSVAVQQRTMPGLGTMQRAITNVIHGSDDFAARRHTATDLTQDAIDREPIPADEQDAEPEPDSGGPHADRLSDGRDVDPTLP